MLSSQSSTDTETSQLSINSQHSPLMKQQSSYQSHQQDRESEINKLLTASLLELTNNPNNTENRQMIQALIPISVLLDEMRSDYSTTRTYCLENLDTIALALGPAKAKGLLGGFISNLLKDQDEGVEDVPEEMQVMLTLLQSLPKLIKSIGGPLSGLVLMQPLVETLPDRQKDETKHMYLKAISEILQQMLKDPNAQKLAETYLDSKVQQYTSGNQQEQLTSVLLIATLYSMVSIQNQWLQIYTSFIQQKDVKKKTISLIAEILKKCTTTQDILNIVYLIINHYPVLSEVNKGQLLYSMPVILQQKHIIPNDIYNELMVIFEEVLLIEKTHVQTIFLDIMGDLLAYDKPIIIQTYIKNLKLNDTETKNKSCGLLERIIRHLKANNDYDHIEIILQRINELINDKSTNTKLILTENLMNLLKDEALFNEKERSQLIKLLMDLVQQSDGEFQYKFLQKLTTFESLFVLIKRSCKIMAMNEFVFKLCQIVCSIQTQKNWRMRQQCCVFIQKFVMDISKFNLEDRIIMECSQTIKLCLLDRIHNVREEGGKVLKINIFKKTLNVLFKIIRTKNMKLGHALLMQVVEVYQSPNYLYRLSLILGLKEVFMTIDLNDDKDKQFSKLIGEASRDSAPNIKLALIEAIFYQFQYKDDKKLKNYIPMINEILTRFTLDEDLDVKEASSILIKLF